MIYAINPEEYHLGVAKPFPDPPVKTGLAGISVAMAASDPNHRSMEIFILSVIPDW